MPEPPSAQTLVALLRAVNVSGQRRVPMADLRSSLEDLGLRCVRTYLQSGNVIFDAPEDLAAGSDERIAASGSAAITAAIKARIARDFGHDVEVLVVPSRALLQIAAANPFVGTPGVDERWLHVTFLFGPPAGKARDLALPAADGEHAVIAGDVVYLLLPHGYGRTKLTNAYFEKAFGTAATTRNWRTVPALRELSS